MNILHLEQVFKEYLEVKNYIKFFREKENLEKLKNEIAQKVPTLKSTDEIFDYTFDKIGWISALEADLVQLKIRLYHTYQVFKDEDFAQKEDIEKELENLQFKLTYSVKKDQVELVDKEALNFYKNQAKAIEEYYKSQPNGTTNN